ncbi:MAG TPA: hypothetical protein VMV42_00280 [archaeon]|nr:hypothetical protein [archaeon]
MLSEKQAIEVKTEIVPLTLEITKHYARMTTLKGDRDPDTPKGRIRVAWLFGLLRAGLFHSPVWSDVTLVTGRSKAKQYRVDGGHSATMLVQAGADFPEHLNVTLRHFEATMMDEILDLYEQFNPKISTRTTVDLIKNRKAYIPEVAELAPTNISNAVNGVMFHLKARNPHEQYDPLDLIRPYSAFIAWCAEFIQHRPLRRAGVAGAIFATYAHDPFKALEFWRMVRDGTGTTPQCPTRTLGMFLQECVLTKSYQKNSDTKWSNEALYVKCHHAWNAWRRGGTTNLKYHNGAPLPTLF